MILKILAVFSIAISKCFWEINHQFQHIPFPDKFIPVVRKPLPVDGKQIPATDNSIPVTDQWILFADNPVSVAIQSITASKQSVPVSCQIPVENMLNHLTAYSGLICTKLARGQNSSTMGIQDLWYDDFHRLPDEFSSKYGRSKNVTSEYLITEKKLTGIFK